MFKGLNEIKIKQILDDKESIVLILKKNQLYTQELKTIEDITYIKSLLGQYDFLNDFIVRFLIETKHISMRDIMSRMTRLFAPKNHITIERRQKLHEQLNKLRNK